MQITKLQGIKKNNKIIRYQVFINDKIAFVLYKGDLRRYGIYYNSEFPQEITEENYNEIVDSLLPKRAEGRLLHLLEKRDYTEEQLRIKLKEGYYPESAVDYAIEKMKSYNYINDERYARRYAEFSIEKKTFRQVEQDLIKKGIDKKIITNILDELREENLGVSELELAKQLLIKRHYDAKTADEKERAKQYRYLLSKGFSSSVIVQTLKMEW